MQFSTYHELDRQTYAEPAEGLKIRGRGTNSYLEGIIYPLGLNRVNLSAKLVSSSARFRRLLYVCRGWCIKFATGLNIINRQSSKSIRVIKLSFCQNDPLIAESFWQKDSLITCILFELCLFMIFSPVANLMHHPLL